MHMHTSHRLRHDLQRQEELQNGKAQPTWLQDVSDASMGAVMTWDNCVFEQLLMQLV